VLIFFLVIKLEAIKHPPAIIAAAAIDAKPALWRKLVFSYWLGCRQ